MKNLPPVVRECALCHHQALLGWTTCRIHKEQGQPLKKGKKK